MRIAGCLALSPVCASFGLPFAGHESIEDAASNEARRRHVRCCAGCLRLLTSWVETRRLLKRTDAEA